MFDTDVSGAITAPVTPGPDHPDVLRMVRLAVKRALPMFEEYHDLDFRSLVADMLGEIVRAWPNYDPTKAQPHTFAYQVAWRRLRDISRRRTTERRNLDKSFKIEGVRLGHCDPAEALEGTDAELGEILRRLYVSVKDRFDSGNLPIRPPKLSPKYPDRAQRLAMLMFQRRMGWTSRKASETFLARPAIGLAIGVTHSPSRQFFSRAGGLVTHIQKIFSATAGPAALV